MSFMVLHLPTTICVHSDFGVIHGMYVVRHGYHPSPVDGVSRIPLGVLDGGTAARFQANWTMFPPWDGP